MRWGLALLPMLLPWAGAAGGMPGGLVRDLAQAAHKPPRASYLPREWVVNAKDGSILVPIAAGRAIFGAAGEEAFDDARPRFLMEMGGFYLALHPVTHTQYARFLTERPATPEQVAEWIDLSHPQCGIERMGFTYRPRPETAEVPVLAVSWTGAQAYCEWAGLRLPRELEWERGARGTDGRLYPWGDEWDPVRCRNFTLPDAQEFGPCAIWQYPEGRSPDGLFDMSGNVSEWCADWYEEDAYGRYSHEDPSPPAQGEWRTMRGGGWGDGDAATFSAWCRGMGEPSSMWDRNSAYGFRCARDL